MFDSYILQQKHLKPCIHRNRTGWKEIGFLFTLPDRAECYMPVATEMSRWPIQHAGSILINLDDDGTTLDVDSFMSIHNKAIEPYDEWRWRKICERLIN